MKKNVAGISLALLSGIISHSALAVDLPPICSMYDDHESGPRERALSVQAGRITRGALIELLSEPQQPSTSCEQDNSCVVGGTSFVSGGKPGLELRRSSSWVCVAVPGKRPLDVWVGWIRAVRWDKVGTSASIRPGVWQNESAKITIHLLPDSNVAVSGNAIWSGTTTNFGEFSFTSPLSDRGPLSSIQKSKYDCHVVVRVFGDLLFAADNHQCGGQNVTFNGVYRLRPSQH